MKSSKVPYKKKEEKIVSGADHSAPVGPNDRAEFDQAFKDLIRFFTIVERGYFLSLFLRYAATCE